VTQERYPLSWPSGWKRTTYRKVAKFSKRVDRGQGWKSSESLSVGEGLDRLNAELKRLGATDVVISSNLKLNRDGSINRGQAMGPDPGVAVYFKLKGKPRCMASDTWTRLPDNMAAIAGTIEALRSIDRYGVGNIEQVFAGYTALQPAADVDWWIVLGVSASAPLDAIEDAYRTLAKTAHPDAGGSADDMARLNIAIATARAAKGSR
jgi:hypothetical protein